MRPQDIRIGEYYRHKDNPNYGWAKPIELLKPGKGANTTTKTVVKCEWSLDKNPTVGLIKYFAPANLVRP